MDIYGTDPDVYQCNIHAIALHKGTIIKPLQKTDYMVRKYIKIGHLGTSNHAMADEIISYNLVWLFSMQRREMYSNILKMNGILNDDKTASVII